MTEKFRKDYKAPTFTVSHVDLSFQLDFDLVRVESKLTLKGSGDLVLDFDFGTLKTIKLNNKLLSSSEYEFVAEKRQIQIKCCTPQHEEFTVDSSVEFDPSSNRHLEGMYTSGPIVVTHNEAEGFRRIVPMVDRPDVMSTYRVRLEGDVEKLPVLLCNGNLVEQGKGEGGRHYVVYVDQVPKPSYLFAVVGGDLKSIEDTHIRPDGRPVKLLIWGVERDLGKLKWAMESLKKAMVWDEEKYGRVYDLDVYNIVGVEWFNMGAMENKSLNIFNSSRLLMASNAQTDAQFIDTLGTVGHEYFHNWTGNRIPLRDWFQVTLKEGLTEFRNQEFQEDMAGTFQERIKTIKMLRSAQFAEDASPVRHPIRPDSYVVMGNFYTATVYDKGAAVCRMYKSLLGSAGFRKGMDLYFERFDGKAVTCDDFLAAMAEANNCDLSQFALWYSQAGTPEVRVEEAHWNAENHSYSMRVSQRIPGSDCAPLHIPIGVALLGRNSRAVISHTAQVKSMKGREEEWTFNNVQEDAVPSLLRDFSAPIRVLHERDDETLGFIVDCESDEFARWDAAQELFGRCVLKRAEERKNKQLMGDVKLPEYVTHVVMKMLLPNKTASDFAFRAAVLSLPTVNDLILRGNADPVETHEARKDIRRALLKQFRAEFLKMYQELSTLSASKDYRLVPEDISIRSLRNVLLSYLTLDEEFATLAFSQFVSASNMTERQAAFACLIAMDLPYRQEVLSAFHDLARQDPNLMNKWFSLQASCDRKTVLEDVEALWCHPDFEQQQPNCLYALLRSFISNMPHYHEASGRGYSCMRQRVAKVDEFNPTVAARLASLMSASITCLDESRQKLLRAEFQLLMERTGCSSALAEICKKVVL